MPCGPRFLVATLLALVLTPAAAQQPDTTDLVWYKTKHFDMFAPTKEIAAAKEEMVEAAHARFVALLGKTPPRAALVMADPARAEEQWKHQAAFMAHGAKWVMTWYAHHPMGEGLWPPYGQTNQIGGGDPLPHETAHIMLVYAVNDGCSMSLKQKFNGYGSYLPDWVDEGVAIYVEHQAIRAAQRKLMAENLDQRIPFKEFFTMDHPGAPKIKGKANPESGHGFAGGMNHAHIYYLMTITVLEFLEAAGGVEYVRKMIKAFQGGTPMEKTLKYLPEQYPRDLDELEKVWAHWIETDELPPAPEPKEKPPGDGDQK